VQTLLDRECGVGVDVEVKISQPFSFDGLLVDIKVPNCLV